MDIWRSDRNRLLLALGWLLSAGAITVAAQNSCVDCHSVLDPPLKVSAEQHAVDIHTQKGLTCVSCHGGDPEAMDETSMSKAKGFRGKIRRQDIPKLCGSCHANGAYMRQYDPSLRTDQLSQYATSVHGKRLAMGDTKVAVCVDCHGVHGIRAASDPLATIHPLKIANTCSRCHADAAYMKPYKIPTDQFAGYSASVHHEAMTVRGDLSAPTCSSCHGNHGAAPPGIAAVEAVCATCHVVQADLFDKSPHKKAFAESSLPGCITCHSNHRVVSPNDNWVGAGEASTCVSCHVEGDKGFSVAVEIRKRLAGLEAAIARSDATLKAAEQSGMEVSEVKLEQDQARDALTKARVTLHSVQLGLVDEDINAGMKVAAKTQLASAAALKERDFRRFGLGLSLIAILAVVIGLRLTITMIEKNGNR